MSGIPVEILPGIGGGGLLRTGNLVQFIFPDAVTAEETYEPADLYTMIAERQDDSSGALYILPLGRKVKVTWKGHPELVFNWELMLNALAKVRDE